MKKGIAVFAALFVCLLAQAGEIVILQSESQETRNEKNLDRTMDKARQNAGKQAAPLVIEDGVLDRGGNAERSSRDAQEYLRSADSPKGSGDEKTTIIFRSVPLTESEKSRQKAAAFVPPSGSSVSNRACGDASLTIGTVGDKTVIERTTNVNERGNSSVNVNCRK